MDQYADRLIEAHLAALTRLVAIWVSSGCPSKADEIDTIMDDHDATVAAIRTSSF